jgi:hypothetical protein
MTPAEIADGYKDIARRLREHFDLPAATTDVIDTTATDTTTPDRR